MNIITLVKEQFFFKDIVLDTAADPYYRGNIWNFDDIIAYLSYKNFVLFFLNIMLSNRKKLVQKKDLWSL